MPMGNFPNRFSFFQGGGDSVEPRGGHWGAVRKDQGHAPLPRLLGRRYEVRLTQGVTDPR